MSQFKAEVVEVKLEKHPNADSLSIAIVKGWQCIVKTSDFEGAALGAYIPIDSVLPELPEWDFLKDRKYRVKTIKLRGTLSQGLLIPAKPEWVLGQDVTEELGVKKFEVDEVLFRGDRIREPAGMDYHTDIERIQNFPNVFTEEDDVIITEKIHGTNARYALIDGVFYVGGHRCALTHPGETVYSKMAEKLGIESKMRSWFQERLVIVYGEIFGYKVQKLRYGKEVTRDQDFRIFDIQVNGRFLNWDELQRAVMMSLMSLELEWVPELYDGKFSMTKVEELAEGLTVVGKGVHEREGIVIRSKVEAFNPEIGRKWLKRISNSHLLKE